MMENIGERREQRTEAGRKVGGREVNEKRGKGRRKNENKLKGRRKSLMKVKSSIRFLLFFWNRICRLNSIFAFSQIT